ncbi:MAG: radical SAM family heme chaperone HemW [Clostridia bacterium]|nr:radical SAM family heme chaperone HemW [Clostridia bacterium]
MKLTNRKPLGLYIHIPFCRSKCEYCDFCSFVPSNSGVVEHYTDALILQMEDWSERCRGYEIDSIYFGGGTPTYLDMKHFSRIMDAVYGNFHVTRDAEISTECNPATVDFKYLKALRKNHVNRISIGVQSANANELKALGRIHSYEDFVKTYDDARKAGFDNVSVDLMYGIPLQTEESFGKTVSTITSLEPEHLSLYALKIEDNTPFARKRDKLVLPGEDAEYNMYMRAVEYLKTKGYERYEISNFSKRGFASLHNLKYWHCDEYLGLGASASSYFEGQRFVTTRAVRDYIDGLEIIDSNIDIVTACDDIGSKESMDEYVMLGMRLEEGVNIADFEDRFSLSFHEKYGKLLDEYVDDGFVIATPQSYRFTTMGMFVSNYILSSILDLGIDD